MDRANKYLTLIGSILYLCNTRLELAYILGVLEKFTDPEQSYWQSGMCTLRYLKGMVRHDINVGRGRKLFGCFDSDYARDLGDTRLTSNSFTFWIQNIFLVQKEQTELLTVLSRSRVHSGEL